METNQAMTLIYYRRALIILGICLSLGLAGCNGGPKFEVGLVQGAVRVNGAPTRGILVQFTPDREKGNGLSIIANGTSDEQGKYALKYGYQNKVSDGVPVGWFRVTVVDTSGGSQARIPATYTAQTTSPFLFEVKAGENTIDLDVKK